MRIAHVVPYRSVDGAYGGPVAVAKVDAEALAAQGHTVDLLSGWDGNHLEPPVGANAKLYRSRALTKRALWTLWSPGLNAHLRRHWAEYDVIHLHVGRDLTSLGLMLATRHAKNVVVQPHGMIQKDTRLRARIVDRLIVRRRLSTSNAILVLTQDEAVGLQRAGMHNNNILFINNAIAMPITNDESRVARTVLFLARLHPRKNVAAFLEAARLLIANDVDATFLVGGPDEGDLPKVKQALNSAWSKGRVEYLGAISPDFTFAVLARSTVYVLPSHNEVYPMTVLEALSAGTAVILGKDCAIAPMLLSHDAVTTTGHTGQEIADAIKQLLEDTELRSSQIDAGRNVAREKFSNVALASKLIDIYASSSAKASAA